MTLALGVPSAFVPALQMSWRWFPGMGVRPHKLLLLLELKTVLVVSAVKPPAQLNSLVYGSTWEPKQLRVWVWLIRKRHHTHLFLSIHVGSNIGGTIVPSFFEIYETF